MNRIERIFTDLRGRGDKALMPYLTAGDPDIKTTGRILQAIDAAGAAVCEVGIPYSDPIADGPVIQASMTYALDRGLRTRDIFAAIAERRDKLAMGVVAMVSYTIVHRIGPAAFCNDAKQAGVDGLIVPDLPVEEADAISDHAQGAGLTCSYLIAPTTSPQRAQRLAKASSGFIYMLARSGITGERNELPLELGDRVERLRDVTDLPVAVGFGISTPRQVRTVVRVADAAIVGSAIMRRVADWRGDGDDAVAERVGAFVKELAGGLVETAEADRGEPSTE
jgi:tryptophan synthase alpha chain